MGLDKLIAVVVMGVIGCVAQFTDPDTSKEIVIPILTGIAGLITGEGFKIKGKF